MISDVRWFKDGPQKCNIQTKMYRLYRKKTIYVLVCWKRCLVRSTLTFKWVSKQSNRLKRAFMGSWVTWTFQECLLGWDVLIKGNGYTFRGDNSVNLVLSPFWKGVYTKRKEFTPLRVNPFSVGECCLGKRLQSVSRFPLVVTFVVCW